MKSWIQWAGTTLPESARIALWTVCTIAIATLSLTRADALPLITFLGEYTDKCVHFGMYLIYALACCLARPPTARFGTALLGIAGFCAAYGFILELLQARIPSLERHFSLADGLANALGAATGAWLWARAMPTAMPKSAHP